jgi:hypothetical protein
VPYGPRRGPRVFLLLDAAADQRADDGAAEGHECPDPGRIAEATTGVTQVLADKVTKHERAHTEHRAANDRAFLPISRPNGERVRPRDVG